MFRKFRTGLKQRRAFTAFSNARYEEALHLFTELYHQYPNTEGARYNIGLCHVALQEYKEAEPYLLEEVKLYGEHFPRFKTLGDLYFLWGKRRKAEKYYTRALDIEPKGLGHTLIRKRIEQCQDVDLFARTQESLQEYHRGIELMKGKDTDGAAQAFTKAIELDEFNIHALNNRGAILLNVEKDYKQATQLFKRALRLQEVPAFRANLEKAIDLERKEKKDD